MFLLIFLTITGCAKSPNITPITMPISSDPASYEDKDPPSSVSQAAVDGVKPRIVIKNTFLRIHQEVGIMIYDSFGELVSKNPAYPVNMDDMNSYTLYIHQGKKSFDSKNMQNMMKYIIFNYAEAPLKDMSVTIEEGQRITMKGTMKKMGLSIPFEAGGPVAATADGLIEIAPDKMKAFGLPVKGLMDLFGIDAANMINLNERKGLKAVGNKFVLYPERLLSAPAMKGKVTKVETKKDELIIYFNDNLNVPRPPLPIAENTYKNYVHVYGGAVRLLGNETHEDTNFMLIDMNQSNVFDFAIPEMLKHAVGAIVQIITPKGALAGYIPDYNDIGKRANRMPKLDGLDSVLGDRFILNPNSDPEREKQQNQNSGSNGSYGGTNPFQR